MEKFLFMLLFYIIGVLTGALLLFMVTCFWLEKKGNKYEGFLWAKEGNTWKEVCPVIRYHGEYMEVPYKYLVKSYLDKEAEYKKIDSTNHIKEQKCGTLRLVSALGDTATLFIKEVQL